MSGPDFTTLESILPEVHDIFSERAAEKDLAIIKKVKKIDTDTRQIVANREAEIKEVVRGKGADACSVPCVRGQPCVTSSLAGACVRCLPSRCGCEAWPAPLTYGALARAALSQRVEKEESAAENDEELRDISDRATLAEEEKQQLQAQVARVPQPVPCPRASLLPTAYAQMAPASRTRASPHAQRAGPASDWSEVRRSRRWLPKRRTRQSKCSRCARTPPACA
jgi:hypothetical protein